MSLLKTKLVILRGPSGAGKSTVARRILAETKRDVVVLEQDMYRKKMTNHNDSFKLRQQMVLQDCLLALDHNYDVILDGIFSFKRHDVLFDEIMVKHPDDDHFFYLDVPFEETVRRHATRDKVNEFGVDSMQDWYAAAAPTNYPGEVIIPADLSVDDAVQLINEKTGILKR